MESICFQFVVRTAYTICRVRVWADFFWFFLAFNSNCWLLVLICMVWPLAEVHGSQWKNVKRRWCCCVVGGVSDSWLFENLYNETYFSGIHITHIRIRYQPMEFQFMLFGHYRSDKSKKNWIIINVMNSFFFLLFSVCVSSFSDSIFRCYSNEMVLHCSKNVAMMGGVTHLYIPYFFSIFLFYCSLLQFMSNVYTFYTVHLHQIYKQYSIYRFKWFRMNHFWAYVTYESNEQLNKYAYSLRLL